MSDEQKPVILEPFLSKGKTALTVARTDKGVLFRVLLVEHESPVPLGETVIAWHKLEFLIGKLQEFRDANMPKHYHVELATGSFGVKE